MTTKDVILDTFGKRLWEIRQQKRMTQEEVAFKSGLHPTYVGGVERGERNISLINIVKLAWALDVPPTELLIHIPNQEK